MKNIIRTVEWGFTTKVVLVCVTALYIFSRVSWLVIGKLF